MKSTTCITEITIQNNKKYLSAQLFKSFEFGNGSQMSDKNLVILDLNLSIFRTKNGRNKL